MKSKLEVKGTEQLLPMRELLGLDKALRSIRGELANNTAKLGEIDTHIDKEKQKLKDLEQLNPEDKNFQLERIKNRLKDLKEEREARLELLSQNKRKLKFAICTYTADYCQSFRFRYNISRKNSHDI